MLNNLFQIPAFLEPTPERISDSQKEQVRLRKKYGYDSREVRQRGQSERDHNYAEREIVLAFEGLLSLKEHDPGNAFGIQFEERRLADNLCRTGQFTEALLYAVDDTQRAYIEKMQHAVERDDSERCDCPEVFISGVHIPHRSVIGETHSPKHGKLTPVVVCSQCHCTNVTPIVPKRADLNKLFPKGRPSLAHLKRR